MAGSAGKGRRREGGVALILALLVLAILIVLIGQMTATSLHNRTVSENQLADLQNAYGTRSGYHQGLLFLQADLEKAPNVDSLQERWAAAMQLEVGRARVTVEVRDAERGLNLSTLVNEKGEAVPAATAQLQRLVLELGHTPDVADRIIDYVDGDARGGFESRARNDRLFNVDELLRVEGLTREVVFGGEGKRGVAEFVTVWPREAPEGGGPVTAAVNVNTAPAEVLASLSDKMTPGAAQAIVAWRAQPGEKGKLREFARVDEVRGVEGMTDEIYASIANQISVRSETFEIRVRSAMGNIEKSWVYVVYRKGGERPSIKLLASQRASDPVSLKPPSDERP